MTLTVLDAALHSTISGSVPAVCHLCPANRRLIRRLSLLSRSLRRILALSLTFLFLVIFESILLFVACLSFTLFSNFVDPVHRPVRSVSQCDTRALTTWQLFQSQHKSGICLPLFESQADTNTLSDLALVNTCFASHSFASVLLSRITRSNWLLVTCCTCQTGRSFGGWNPSGRMCRGCQSWVDQLTFLRLLGRLQHNFGGSANVSTVSLRPPDVRTVSKFQHALHAIPGARHLCFELQSPWKAGNGTRVAHCVHVSTSVRGGQCLFGLHAGHSFVPKFCQGLRYHHHTTAFGWVNLYLFCSFQSIFLLFLRIIFAQFDFYLALFRFLIGDC